MDGVKRSSVCRNWYTLHPNFTFVLITYGCCFPSDFGAVLINIHSGRIEEQFQSYVQPTEFYITHGCVRALGISNKTVDGYPPLRSVVSKFQQWMNDVRNDYDLDIPHRGRSYEENAYICTWSNMDLGCFLRKECNNKDISYAHYLKWWLDAQEIYHVSNCCSPI